LELWSRRFRYGIEGVALAVLDEQLAIIHQLSKPAADILRTR
jgi:hypothetical protein